MYDRYCRRGPSRAAILVALLGLPGMAIAQELAAGGPATRVGADTRPDAVQATGSDRVLELTLTDAVLLAVRHNLQVRIGSLAPDIQQEQIRFARSRFDPVFTFNVPQTFGRSSTPSSSVLGGADVVTNEQIAGGFQFSANTTWGLSWALSASASRFITNNEFSTFNPRYDTSLGLNVRQPLMRNLGNTNKRQVIVAQNDYSVSRESFRQQLQNNVFTVVQAYWGLVSQYRGLDIARQSLALAQEQLQRNNTMVRIGVLAAVDVIQTEQQVADAELTVIQRQIALRNQEDLLKSLLNLDAVVREGWDVDIVPLDDPVTQSESIDVSAAIAEALLKSPAIRQDRLNLASRKIDVDAAHNQLLPQLDFIGNVTLSGLGGDQIFRSGSVFGGSGVVEVQQGGLSESFQQLLSGDFRNWSLGLQLSIPVRNDQARAQHAQATVRERQAATQVQDRELQIRLAVNTAVRNIQGGTQQVEAAQSALTLAERQYAAELRRFETGTSSTFTVLAFQRQLTLARQRELTATIGLNVALANFELSKGTLLDDYGIAVDDAGHGGPMMQSRQRTQTGTAPETTAAMARAARARLPMPVLGAAGAQRR